MGTVVAFISQKGGVGKSTLARALATYAVRRGIIVRVADLDAQQATITVWSQARVRNGISPPIEVDRCLRVKDALAHRPEEGLLIIDAPGTITDELVHLTAYADLLVQPTSPTIDDLYPAVFVFQALENVGVARNQLAFALCRTLADSEGLDARNYLDSLGYAVLAGEIPEQLEYRQAMNEGRAITEGALGARAQAMMANLLVRTGPSKQSPSAAAVMLDAAQR